MLLSQNHLILMGWDLVLLFLIKIDTRKTHNLITRIQTILIVVSLSLLSLIQMVMELLLQKQPVIFIFKRVMGSKLIKMVV